MLFIVLLLALIGYHTKVTAHTSVDELWFMLTLFAGAAYIAGFIDSRIFAHFDQKKGNLLKEVEEHYEAVVDETTPHQS